MRLFLTAYFVATAWLLTSPATAQEVKKYQAPAIRKVRMGFMPYQQNGPNAYKVGLWTPVHIEVFGGTDGIVPDPKQYHHLVLETTDSEDVGTQIFIPVAVEPEMTRTFTGYIKTGHITQFGRGGGDVKVHLKVKSRDYEPREFDQPYALDINAHLYLTLGSRMTDLHNAVRKIGKAANEKEDPNSVWDTEGRHVAYETDVDRLPEAWFGYNGVDVVFLPTENRRFLNALGAQPLQLKALAQWVRRGGRLVVPVAWQNQDALAEMLENKIAWQPPIPVVPPRSQGNAKLSLMRLNKVEDWGGVRGEPFQGMPDPKDPQKKQPIPVAVLDSGKVAPGDWEVQAETAEGQPLIARVRYGLGQIYYLAFSLEDNHFFNWPGKEAFLKSLVTKIATKAPTENNPQFQQQRRFGQSSNVADLSTELIAQLDNFDVTVIPFGAVALFIVLYIVVVGPLDFILLKYVFKRLEWTWITFPTVVLAVSVIAYFAAYALKGQDLKINKVDIVDFDLRTKDIDDEGKPRAHAYGHSFFTILSPRIQNYTIGLEPNAAFWGEKPGRVLSVDLMSWMGRPSADFNGMGRSGSGGFFRRPYVFREDAAALEGVPIPVWTTKAFSASWEETLATTPLKAELVYHLKPVNNRELKITGTIESHLGVDLVDVWVFYDKNQCFALPEGLKSMKPQTIAIAANPHINVQSWAATENPDVAQEKRATAYNPTPTVKRLLFLELMDIQGVARNHLLRTIDQGWRNQEELPIQRDRRTREAVLVGRVAPANGSAESLTTSRPLPTNLWLGDTPEPGKTRPPLVGQLNQDTYVRIFLPVRPAEE